MALTQRFLRLFQADLHGVLEHLEEPETLLKYALREMEEELAQGELAQQQLAQDTQAITRRQQENSASIERINQELDLCFSTDNDALARTLLKRKLEMKKLSQHLARTQQELDVKLQALRRQVAQNRSHYDSVRQRVDVLEQYKQWRSGPGERDADWPEHPLGVREEEVDIALLKEKQRRALLAGESS